MGVLSALKSHPPFPFFCSVALIPRGAPEQATRLENHAYSNRGSGNINSAIDQGSIAAGHVPLMELVGKGIEAHNADAPYRLTQPPPKRLLLDRKSTRLNSSHANISYAV